jgi:hypothetical protein
MKAERRELGRDRLFGPNTMKGDTSAFLSIAGQRPIEKNNAETMPSARGRLLWALNDLHP